MGADRDDEVVRVAEVFGELARSLRDSGGPQATLEKVVRRAVEMVDACEYAGVSWVEGGQISSPASSNEIPRILDAIQTEVGEGPCIDAIADHDVFQTGSLPSEDRWPMFSERASDETGVCSILALRLYVGEDTMGALNLYSARPDAFDDTDVALGAVFAAHAAVALAAAREAEQLEAKARSRDLIGQAKGILMARADVDEDQAIDMLRRASQRLNVKLSKVAERIVHPDPD